MNQNPTTPIIGLYGGVGSGKSTVAALFAALGAVVFDADECVTAAYRDPAVIDQLVAAFGPEAVQADGTPDRRWLADVVFAGADATARRRLEAIVHPRVQQMIRDGIAAAKAGGAPAVVLDVPLLATSPLADTLDAGVFVDSPQSAREARVHTTRGWDAAELARRDAAQPTLGAKRALCQHVVTNDESTSTDDLRVQVRTIWTAITGRDAATHAM